MDNKSLVDETNIISECNICYEECKNSNTLINLKCCMNTKKICIKCINCLTVALCPYCRSDLDDECKVYINEPLISRSAPERIETFIGSNPYSFDDFIREEHVIDPSLYNDSRRLRRQIRRLRHEYNQRRYESSYNTRNNERRSRGNSSRYNRNQQNRNNRHFLNNETNNLRRLYNNLNGNINLNSIESQYLFDIEM